jgi:NADH dehydrogenase
MSSSGPSAPSGAGGRPRILILGGGYVGMYTALRLRKRLHRGEADVVVVDPRTYMTYQPFLAEAAAGSVEARHVVVPLRRELRGVEIVNGRVTGVSHRNRTVTVALRTGERISLGYDHVVVALGSVARTLPVPGLRDVGMGFKHVEEAIALRNHVLERLEAAAASHDPDVRRRALTFLFVGAGYAGTEALAEVEDMARAALAYYDGLHPQELRFVLVEASGRILPEVSPEMSTYTVNQLRARGVDVRLTTRLESCTTGDVLLSDGTRFQADTVVWTAGVRAHPVLEQTDLPLDDRGRLRCTPALRVGTGQRLFTNVWGAGDCAAVPDLTAGPGALCSPSAQHAVRQARVLADNLVSTLRGGRLKQYRYRHAGSVASLGLYKGVAHIYGRNFKGFPAWVMHRTYHLIRVPTLNRKVRIVLDWTLALFFRRELVALGRLQHPRHEFLLATRQPLPPSTPREPAGDSRGERRVHSVAST